MKIGLSTYSLSGEIVNGKMSVLDAVQWIADNGGEHVEIVPFGFDLNENDLAEKIKEKARKLNIDVSNYAISADFLKVDKEEHKGEIKRVMKEVDIANRLGVKFMRHDVVGHVPSNDVIAFQESLPKLVDAIREIADYAAQYGITTSVENHGMFINGSERIQQLIYKVDRPNFKMTLDVGNFWCVDEEPVIGVKKCIDLASMVHFKDFYHREPWNFTKEGAEFKYESGWFRTLNGSLLRGSIIGDGDINISKVMEVIKNSSYNGYISVEFEGMEECKLGSLRGMQYLKVLADNV